MYCNCIEVNDIKSTTKLVLIMLANYADEIIKHFQVKNI